MKITDDLLTAISDGLKMSAPVGLSFIRRALEDENSRQVCANCKHWGGEPHTWCERLCCWMGKSDGCNEWEEK